MKTFLHNACFLKARCLVIGTLMLMFVATVANALGGHKTPPEILQARVVTGTVTSGVDGSVLPGVNILVKGTNSGVVTDNDGQYSIRVADENSVLVFSFIGYVTQEVPVNGRTTINIGLDEDVQKLEELIIVSPLIDITKGR